MNNLEETLIKTNNKELKIIAFIGIGIGAFSMVSPIIAGMALATTPFLISSLLARYKMNKNKDPFSLMLFNKHYQYNFTEETNNYFDNSKSLTEKKYKIILVKMFLEYKDIFIYNVIGYGSIINSITEELKKENLTKHELGLVQHVVREYTYYNFFEEDSNKPENIQIAKEVYQNFKDLGMLGESIKHNKYAQIPLLMELQNYQLTEKDINILQAIVNNHKENTKYVQDGETLHSTHLMKESINKLIEKQTDEKTLILLSKFLKNLSHGYQQEAELSEKLAQVIKLEKSCEKVKITTIRNNAGSNLSKNVNKI